MGYERIVRGKASALLTAAVVIIKGQSKAKFVYHKYANRFAVCRLRFSYLCVLDKNRMSTTAGQRQEAIHTHTIMQTHTQAS